MKHRPMIEVSRPAGLPTKRERMAAMEAQGIRYVTFVVSTAAWDRFVAQRCGTRKPGEVLAEVVVALSNAGPGDGV